MRARLDPEPTGLRRLQSAREGAGARSDAPLLYDFAGSIKRAQLAVLVTQVHTDRRHRCILAILLHGHPPWGLALRVRQHAVKLRPRPGEGGPLIPSPKTASHESRRAAPESGGVDVPLRRRSNASRGTCRELGPSLAPLLRSATPRSMRAAADREIGRRLHGRLRDVRPRRAPRDRRGRQHARARAEAGDVQDGGPRRARHAEGPALQPRRRLDRAVVRGHGELRAGALAAMKRLSRRRIVEIAFAVAALAALLALLQLVPLEGLVEWLEDLGAWGPLALAALFVLTSL